MERNGQTRCILVSASGDGVGIKHIVANVPYTPPPLCEAALGGGWVMI